MAIQETTMGQEGERDLLTINNIGDPNDYKQAYGMAADLDPTENESLFFGIRFLATKATERSTAGVPSFIGWFRAAGKYNGWGVENTLGIDNKDRSLPSKYEKSIVEIIDNSTTPTAASYGN